MEKVILFISTDATRTGTPVLLVNILNWIKLNSNIKFVLLLQEDGELLENYKQLGKVYIWPDFLGLAEKLPSDKLWLKVFKSILLFGRRLVHLIFVLRLKSKYNVQLIFSNTARNGNIIRELRKYYSTKIISYIHEGDRILESYNINGAVQNSVTNSDLILCVSETVKNVIQNKYLYKKEILTIPGGIDINYQFNKSDRELLRIEGIPDDRIILLCCGWMDWHKGIDLFILLAKYLCEINEKVHFVWVGGNSKDNGFKLMKFEIEKLNLSNRISLIPSKPFAQSYIGCADIFLQLSREESFSLVTLEAGLARKPILCFDKSGGPLEIVNYDRRFIVPYIDIISMSERILEILNNNDLKSEMSNYLFNRIISNYSIEKCASTVLDTILKEMHKSDS